MSRTLAGNLTGTAAQGHDDIYDTPSPYAIRLKKAMNAVYEIINDKWAYLDLTLHIKDEYLLETMETIVSQCAEYDAETAEAEPTFLDRVMQTIPAQPYTSYKPSAEELAKRYDFTPMPSNMPVIDIDKIDEIKF